jgi:hypothetical protein
MSSLSVIGVVPKSTLQEGHLTMIR